MVGLQDDDNEIIRYTLYGYVGTKIQNIDIKSRQKKSYAKLSFLTDVQFLNLVKDIKIEINRRVLGIQSPETENKKLSALIESKFQDLVIDVFFMYNKRVPSIKFENTEEPGLLLFNFENLIHSLKNDNEAIMRKLKSQDSIFDKFEHYQNFLKNEMSDNTKNTEIIDFMTSIFQMKELILMEILTEPEYLKTICEKMLKNNPYYLQIQEKVAGLENEEDINEKNKVTLDVLELLLYKNSYNGEIEETIDLLANHEKYGSTFEKRIKKLVKGIKRHAERVNDSEKILMLQQFYFNTQKKRKDEKILYLADILRGILVKERNCIMRNELFEK